MKNYLIPECYTEQELLLIIGFNRKNDINKASGCSSVISIIKNSYDNRLAIGWIDQDPNKQNNRGRDYFEYKEDVLPKYKVRLLKKPNKPHYLIEIEDDFEKWFEPIGNAKGIKRNAFGITRTLHEYAKEEIKPNVRKYLDAVVKADSVPFEYIRQLITGLIEKHKNDL